VKRDLLAGTHDWTLRVTLRRPDKQKGTDVVMDFTRYITDGKLAYDVTKRAIEGLSAETREN
jgi:hypothetical protein